MSADYELLQLAAKAAGIKALRDPHGMLRNCTGAAYEANIFAMPMWNPLTDDGDALRLAVALRLDIRFGATDGVYVAGNSGLSFDTLAPEVATRRAIVRAAASLSA